MDLQVAEALGLAALGLVGGVILGAWSRPRSAAPALLDGLVLAAVGGLLLVHVVPWSLAAAGGWAVAALLGGAVLPSGVARAGARFRGVGRALVGAVLGAGLFAHGFFDGVGVVRAAQPGTHVELLALGLVLHRLPIGLALGLHAGPRTRWGAAVILTLGVVLGALVGEASVPKSAEVGAGVLQAAVAGTFARLLSTRPTIPQTSNLARRWGALGVLAGLALVVALTRAHPISRHCSEELRAAETFLRLALESAPALLVAFAGVGLLSFVGATPLAWMGRGGPLSQATRGALVGLPIPVCSCGVLPVYRSLARRGVPLAAALAFLVATPELGIDSVLLSWSLLGPELTIARVVLAAFVAITVAVLTSHGASPPEDLGALDAAEVAPARPMRERWLSTIDEHARHVIPWVVVGLVTAALIEPLVHDAALTQIPPWAQVPAGALLGLPLYVCASGSTPLAAVLMHKGLSAGAALALLLTGPATNLTTFGLLRALHGPRVAVRFAISMFVLATIGGWTVDLFFSPDVVALAHPDPRTSASSVAWASLVVLGAWTLRTLWLAGPRGFLGGLRLHDHGPSASRMSRGSPKFVKVPGRSKLARVPGASHVHDESCGCH